MTLGRICPVETARSNIGDVQLKRPVVYAVCTNVQSLRGGPK